MTEICFFVLCMTLRLCVWAYLFVLLPKLWQVVIIRRDVRSENEGGIGYVTAGPCFCNNAYEFMRWDEICGGLIVGKMQELGANTRTEYLSRRFKRLRLNCSGSVDRKKS